MINTRKRLFGRKNLPIDKETLNFLVEETIDNALQDTKEKLNELAYKYKLKIIVKPPLLVEIEHVEKGKVVWDME
jgi:P pilus assembly chaperone PapD